MAASGSAANRAWEWAKDACLARSDGLNTSSSELHPHIVASAATAKGPEMNLELLAFIPARFGSSVADSPLGSSPGALASDSRPDRVARREEDRLIVRSRFPPPPRHSTRNIPETMHRSRRLQPGRCSDSLTRLPEALRFIHPRGVGAKQQKRPRTSRGDRHEDGQQARPQDPSK